MPSWGSYYVWSKGIFLIKYLPAIVSPGLVVGVATQVVSPGKNEGNVLDSSLLSTCSITQTPRLVDSIPSTCTWRLGPSLHPLCVSPANHVSTSVTSGSLLWTFPIHSHGHEHGLTKKSRVATRGEVFCWASSKFILSFIFKLPTWPQLAQLAQLGYAFSAINSQILKLRLKCLLILSTFLRPHSHCWYQTFSVIVLSPGARSFFHGYLLLLCSWPSLMSAPLGKLSPHSRQRKSPPPVLRMLFINNSTLTFAQLNSNYLPRHLSHWQDCELPSPRATTMDFKLAQCGHKVDV